MIVSLINYELQTRYYALRTVTGCKKKYVCESVYSTIIMNLAIHFLCFVDRVTQELKIQFCLIPPLKIR
jgi:hypothetical protein